VRRGYFVEGLGAAQFALPGAVDRIRTTASDFEDVDVVALAATDPAQPYGAALRWPESAGRPARVAGAYVVLVDGHPAIFLERGGKSLVSFPMARVTSRWVDELKRLVETGMLKRLEISKIDGDPASASTLSDVLVEHGFVKAYKGLTWHGPTRR
jgi:ATP-dependent Lhr-like helicase